MEKLDAVVIGAGVVGLAVARALAMAGREVVILEAEDAIGTHTSSRNSEVIHAGIYYPKGSLKARSCVAGKELLYEYCVAHGVPHRRSGKLIVATDDAQLPELEQIQKKAHANGVTDVVWMTRAQVLALEPELSCVAGLYSPSTGIIDSHALMLAYLGDAEAHGAMLALKSHLLGAQVTADGFVVHSDQMDVACNVLVNSAGLRAPSVARTIEGFSGKFIPKEFYAKGNYYSLTRKAPFSRLVYPVPEPGGLGVHVTLDLAGQARFGPDVEWVERIDYAGRPEARGALLRRDPQVLARPAGRSASPRLCRHPPENRGTERAGAGFRSAGTQGARHSGDWCTSSASSRPASPPAWP